MCTCIKREVIKICNQFVTPALKVFLAWKKQKQKTKQKQNKTIKKAPLLFTQH